MILATLESFFAWYSIQVSGGETYRDVRVDGDDELELELELEH